MGGAGRRRLKRPRSCTSEVLAENFDRRFENLVMRHKGVGKGGSRRRTRSLGDEPSQAPVLNNVLQRLWPAGTSLEVSIVVTEPSLIEPVARISPPSLPLTPRYLLSNAGYARNIWGV